LITLPLAESGVEPRRLAEWPLKKGDTEPRVGGASASVEVPTRTEGMSRGRAPMGKHPHLGEFDPG